MEYRYSHQNRALGEYFWNEPIPVHLTSVNSLGRGNIRASHNTTVINAITLHLTVGGYFWCFGYRKLHIPYIRTVGIIGDKELRLREIRIIQCNPKKTVFKGDQYSMIFS